MSTVSGDQAPVVRVDRCRPANLIHDGSERRAGAVSGQPWRARPVRGVEVSVPAKNVYGAYDRVAMAFHDDAGGVLPRPNQQGRPGVKHSCQMAFLVRLAMPPSSVVQDAV